MLRKQTVAIVSQCQLRYENSTKKIVSSFPHAKAQGRMGRRGRRGRTWTATRMRPSASCGVVSAAKPPGAILEIRVACAGAIPLYTWVRPRRSAPSTFLGRQGDDWAGKEMTGGHRCDWAGKEMTGGHGWLSGDH